MEILTRHEILAQSGRFAGTGGKAFESMTVPTAAIDQIPLTKLRKSTRAGDQVHHNAQCEAHAAATQRGECRLWFGSLSFSPQFLLANGWLGRTAGTLPSQPRGRFGLKAGSQIRPGARESWEARSFRQNDLVESCLPAKSD